MGNNMKCYKYFSDRTDWIGTEAENQSPQLANYLCSFLFTAGPPCSDGWQTLGNNMKCYKYFEYRTDWMGAEANCVSEGGHLVKINSINQNQVIYYIDIDYDIQSNEFTMEDNCKLKKRKLKEKLYCIVKTARNVTCVNQ